jgi:hypothetical protein
VKAQKKLGQISEKVRRAKAICRILSEKTASLAPEDLPAIQKAFDALLMLEGLDILLRADDAHSVGGPDDETH